MKKIFYSRISESEKQKLLERPASLDREKIEIVKDILEKIKSGGTEAAIEFAKRFDDKELTTLKVSEKEIDDAEAELDENLKQSLKISYDNIYKFHKLQLPKPYEVETSEGVLCKRKFTAIENVGLYIPGGTAPLPSTLLMLAIPAKIAECKRVVVCTPSKNDKLNPVILYAAKLCGIKEIYKIGGAQAIGLMSFGGNNFPTVDKIFGPGNQFVTIAKMLVSGEYAKTSIDMPAGPSELLVIADKNANPAFVASDILSQAEHGYDSQSILVTDSETYADKVSDEVERQLKLLKRKEYAEVSISNSFILITESIDEAFEFSNRYAPEHLIVNLENLDEVENKIINAGSVFIGQFTPESAGDYASGTNHTLPTSGFAKSIGGVSVTDFMKATTFQKISRNGLKNLSNTIINIADAEGLQAHAKAVITRFANED